jgi:hypothetical protein
VRAAVAATLLALGACRSGFDLLDDGSAGPGNEAGVLDGDTDGPDAPDRPNRVFITSTQYPANFGGIAAADAICQTRADAAGLGGTFIALLGIDARPELRLVGSRGWVDLKGTPIVDEPATWLDGYMFHPVFYDETGTQLGYVSAWSGSLYSCTGWTVTTSGVQGSIVTTAEAFGAFTVTQCTSSAHLICVESGHVAPQSPPTIAGRLHFVTVGQWTPGGGLASADAVCTAEATAKGFPGTYRALLTTSTQDAFARFSLTGLPWMRPDGIALTATAADLANPATTWLASFPSVRSDGTRYPYVGAWFGSATANCSDWASGSVAQSGLVGAPAAAYRSFWLSAISDTCNNPRNLTCLQE